MRWLVVLLSFILCIRSGKSYRCNEQKECEGSDQCCNTRSFFNICCPQTSTCCANGPRAKCCGPLDSCCNNHKYRGVACCPSRYRCCGAGRYGGLRNACCYKVPVWLWIIMGISLSSILLMLLLSLVECMVEEQANRTPSNRDSYGNAYHDNPNDYGTYSNYNSNDLYNEPRGYTTPPPSYTTPPPNYDQSVAPNRTTSNQGGGGVQRGETQQHEATDSLDQSDLSGVLADAETSRTDTEGTDLEMSVSLNDSHDVSRDTYEESRDTRDEPGLVSPLGNMWDRYLTRKLKRKSRNSRDGNKSGEEEQSTSTYFTGTTSQLTLDSGIAGEASCSDSDSSFHCSSWEDEEEIRQGNSIVYELNGKKGVTRVPRLQNLVQTDRQTDTQTDTQTNTHEDTDNDHKHVK